MKLLLLLFLFFYSSLLLAQPVTDSLKEVEVKSRRNANLTEQLIKHNAGKVESFDSTLLAFYQGQSIAELVSEQSPVFIKSYGYNSLSTLSFRGASAAQSLVLWQGVPVNNPALGAADLSLLPVFFADQIAIAYGGSSALLGSGNVGGALLLDNDAPSFSKKSIEGMAYVSGGSFGQKTMALRLKLHPGERQNWELSLRAMGQVSENDFSYRDETGERFLLPNARQRSGQLFLSAARKLKQGHISLKAWGQNSWREIPPALFESASLKQQTDRALRLVANWEHRRNALKLAYVAEGLEYEDKAIGLASQALTHRLFLSDVWSKRWQSHEITLMLPFQYDWLEGSGKSQSQVAVAALYLYQKEKWRLHLQGRAGWYDGHFAATPGLGVHVHPTKWLGLSISAQRSFRQPTLNELYYQPGGNPQLKPETGWSGEAGFKATFEKANFSLTQEGTFFARAIQNWIIWYGGAIWTPHNIAEVFSRGAETNTSIGWQSGTFKVRLFAQTAYVRSTTEKSANPHDGSIGKQLPYVPRYNYRLGGRLSWKDWLLSVNYNYTGYRFITSDESQYLTPYELSGAHLAYTFYLKTQKFRVQAACQNLFAERYQVVAFRPMPGRVWQLGCQWQFL